MYTHTGKMSARVIPGRERQTDRNLTAYITIQHEPTAVLCTNSTHIHTPNTSWTSVVSLEDPFHFQLHQARVVSPCLPPPRDDISGVQPVSQPVSYVAMAIGRRTEEMEKKSQNTYPATSSYEARTSQEEENEYVLVTPYIAQSIKGRQPPVPQPPSGIQ